MRLLSIRKLLLLLSLMLATTSCMKHQAVSGPEGLLSILDPNTSLDNSWVIENAPSNRFGIDKMFGKDALFLINGEDSYKIIRRTKASLLSTPYLTWEWYLRPFLGQNHPLRIVIGFHSGNPKSLNWGNDLPFHNRLLSIGWSGSASLKDQLITKQAAAHYVIHGGVEELDRWRAEIVDLTSLYARAWAGDEQTRVQIAFIGLLVDGGQPATRGHVARLWLAR